LAFRLDVVNAGERVVSLRRAASHEPAHYDACQKPLDHSRASANSRSVLGPGTGNAAERSIRVHSAQFSGVAYRGRHRRREDQWEGGR